MPTVRRAEANKAQRSDSPAQQFIQRLPKLATQLTHICNAMSETSPSTIRARGIPVALAVLLALAIALVPLWSTEIPPMLDYHNHLARQYILFNYESSEYLSQYYKVSWHASPYLAFDSIVQGFAQFVPVDVAGKLFLSLLLLLLALAPIALNLALFGRVTPIALIGLLFVHNDTVTLGFVNYLFSIGFALCLLALWIRFREGPNWVRLLAFPILCSLLFFSHLLGYAIYLLMVGSYELGRHIQHAWQRTPRAFFSLTREQVRNLLSIAFQCTLPLAIFMIYGPSTESVSSNTHGGLGRKFELLQEMFTYLMPPYVWTLDRAVTLLLPLVAIALLAMRRLTVPGAMLWPLAAMLVLFFVMPMELFSGWGADHRLLPALGLLLIGSIAPVQPAGPVMRQIGVLATAAIVALVAVRTGAVTVEWRKSNQEYAEYVAAFEHITPGSRMFFAFGHKDGDKQIGLRPNYHLPLLVLSRHAVYAPFLFASNSGGFTLQYQPSVEPMQRLSKGPVLLNGASPNWPAIQGTFDYFILVNEAYFDTPVPQQLVPIYAGPTVKLYRRAPADPS